MQRNKNLINKPGYAYEVSLDAIRHWMKVPAGKKLEWLEDANRFIAQAAPKHIKRLHEAFRNGTI